LFHLQELKDENGRVYKLLSERDFEVRNLRKKREEEKAAFAGITLISELIETSTLYLNMWVVLFDLTSYSYYY